MKSRTYKLFNINMFKAQRQPHYPTQSLLKLHTHSIDFSSEKSNNVVLFDYETRMSFNAMNVFDETLEWDVVSATKYIRHLAREDKHDECIHIFSKMLEMKITPNEFTFGTVIPSSTSLEDLNLGKQFHALATKLSLHSNVYVGSSILNLYSKLSSVDEARVALEDTHEPNVVSYTALISGYLRQDRCQEAIGLFDRMPERNVVTWNAMIGGLSQKGHNEDAVNLFIQMLRQGCLPDQSTFPCVISSAANIAALGMGRSFHASAIKFLGYLNLFVCNSLITFYSKCASLDDSLSVFLKLQDRSVVSWNALICGYAQNGRGREALDLYEDMKCTRIEPNSVTLLGVLTGCNYIGLVDEGYSYFNEARYKNSGILNSEHYACMIDLLSRFGLFDEAKRFINDLPFNVGVGFWKSLLGGCQIHSNMELGVVAARKILALEPGDVASYVMIANAYSAAGRWGDVSMVRREMGERGMKRVPGCSWIEIRDRVYVFTNADTRHSRMDAIYTVLSCFLEDVALSKGFECFVDPCIQIYDHSSLY